MCVEKILGHSRHGATLPEHPRMAHHMSVADIQHRFSLHISPPISPSLHSVPDAEKHAEELCRSAASLLLYSGCLKGKPAQAFLSVLQLLQKGNPLALTQQYGELFRLLAADGYGSWMDYLLDQVGSQKGIRLGWMRWGLTRQAGRPSDVCRSEVLFAHAFV